MPRGSSLSQAQNIQGSQGSYKTWKVLEFYFDIFQDWKFLEKEYRSWKVLEFFLTRAMKYSEFMLLEMYVDRKEN